MNTAPPTPVAPKAPVVVFIGNPNTGKSTLFNMLTSSTVPVSNYTGTTVGCHTAAMPLSERTPVHAVDVPGTYSLAARSEDERLAIDAVLGIGARPRPDLLVVLVDPARLARSLYLVLQLIELKQPMVVCANMMDEAAARGELPDLVELERLLGVPVVGISARDGQGVDELRRVIERELRSPSPARRSPVEWPQPLAAYADEAEALLGPAMRLIAGKNPERKRALGAWLLLSIDGDDALRDAKDLPHDAALALHRRAKSEGLDLVAGLVAMRYRWIDANLPSVMPPASTATTVTDRIDAWLTHPVSGLAIFLATMATLFTALFAGSDPAIALVDSVVSSLASLVRQGVGDLALAHPAIAPTLNLVGELVAEGVLGGVGTLIAFVPQLALLFLFISVLEDCGYLARAAQMADRLLRAAGLPGQAFVPLLSGYACAVPAILATRTMPRERDRLLTMMVIPFTSCSARLPVYTLLIATVFPVGTCMGMPIRPVVLFAMYVFSALATLTAAVVLGRTAFAEPPQATVLELPPFRAPHWPVIFAQVFRKIRSFLSETGGPILFATLVLWGLLTFPRQDPVDLLPPQVVAAAQGRADVLAAKARPLQLERSYAGQLGHAMEPVIAPLGFDWRVGVGLVGAFAAREVFVTTMGVVYDVDPAEDVDSSLRARMAAARWPNGSLIHTPLMGASLMVFFALALQCTSTLTVLYRETRSWRWPLLIFVYSGLIAWTASFIVFQGGQLLGYR